MPLDIAFETPRLEVHGWHSGRNGGSALGAVVQELLTPAVTAALPPSWQGPYDLERAQDWIVERDQESTVLLVTSRSNNEPFGLVIVFEAPSAEEPHSMELRLGYLLAESAWGDGFGSELVGGFVQWCRSHPLIRSIVAGVALSNDASARVLTKNGFNPAGGAVSGEILYAISLTSPGHDR